MSNMPEDSKDGMASRHNRGAHLDPVEPFPEGGGNFLVAKGAMPTPVAAAGSSRERRTRRKHLQNPPFHAT